MNNMYGYGVQSTPPPMPPERNKLAQAAPGILGLVGGIAGAVIGSIIPGAGTIAGAALGATIGGALGTGIGSLFKMHDDSSKTAQYNQTIAQYQQTRQGELQQYYQSMMSQAQGGMMGQQNIMGIMGNGQQGIMGMGGQYSMPTGLNQGMAGPMANYQGFQGLGF